MTTIHKLMCLLKEYDTKGNVMSLAMVNKMGRSGKNLDSIAAGKTNVNKTPDYRPTKKEMEYPNLAKIIKELKMKNSAIGGDKILVGAPLEDIQRLEATTKLKRDTDGTFILPFGDGIRLKKVNGAYMVGYRAPEKPIQTPTDTELTDIPV